MKPRKREPGAQLDPGTLAERLLPVFESREDIAAAYLFGSIASGKANRISDYDIAVLIAPAGFPATPKERLELELDLRARICTALGREDVDLVVLNDASPLLARRATARAKVIFCRNEAERPHFEYETFRRYVDTKPLREMKMRGIEVSLRHGTFGRRNG